MIRNTKRRADRPKAVTLKSVAAEVGLSPGTISLVLNHAPQSHAIPQHTQDRIFAAARELNYQPNPFARALRTRRTESRGIPMQSGDGSRALVFAGAKELSLAIDAIRQAGLRDFSVVRMDEMSS